MNVWITGDYRDHPPPADASLMIADPVYGTAMVDEIHCLGLEENLPSVIFMSPEDLHSLSNRPEQICFWVKPTSTKNTSKRYSRFVEIIAVDNCEFHNDLHWSTRTGVFTDTLIVKNHEWRKPTSLIEKLILNHYPGHGTVYDPCAGSGVVEEVCRSLSIPSVSVEVKGK